MTKKRSCALVASMVMLMGGCESPSSTTVPMQASPPVVSSPQPPAVAPAALATVAPAESPFRMTVSEQMDFPAPERAPSMAADVITAPVAPTPTPTPAAAAPADPYAATIDSLRARGLRCFANLDPARYVATMVMKTTEVGAVTEGSVEAGNVFNEVALACLTDVAKSAQFPFVKGGGRTVRIAVRVNETPWGGPDDGS